MLLPRPKWYQPDSTGKTPCCYCSQAAQCTVDLGFLHLGPMTSRWVLPYLHMGVGLRANTERGKGQTPGSELRMNLRPSQAGGLLLFLHWKAERCRCETRPYTFPGRLLEQMTKPQCRQFYDKVFFSFNLFWKKNIYKKLKTNMVDIPAKVQRGFIPQRRHIIGYHHARKMRCSRKALEKARLTRTLVQFPPASVLLL